MNDNNPILPTNEGEQQSKSTSPESELINADKELESKQLTAKNKLFLEHLANGRPTLEAYKLAGYKGSDHAAYELRSSLNSALDTYLQARGQSKADLMLTLKGLIDQPLSSSLKTVDHQIKLLNLWAKMLPKERPEERPQITAFVINTVKPLEPTSNAHSAPNQVDTTVVDPNNP